MNDANGNRFTGAASIPRLFTNSASTDRVASITGSVLRIYNYDGAGKHYNYFRDYDPAIGRYDESDPLGLRGGVGTYAYVGGNPVSLVDPCGLLTADEAYQHYLGGTGTPMRMAFADIDTSGVKPSSFAAVQAAVTSAKQTKKEGCCTPSTTPIDDRQPFTTGGSNFLLLGNITLRLQGTFVVRTGCTWTFDGTLKSFDDRYDFNASTHRGPIAEWLTSRGREANGTPFWIEIRGAKPAKESGKL